MKANNISIYLIRLILIGGKVLLSLYLAKVLGLEFLGTFTLLLGAVAIVPMIIRAGMATHLSRTVISMKEKDAWNSILSYWSYISVIYVLLSLFLIFTIDIFLGVNLPIALFLVIFLEHIVYDIFIFMNGFKKHYFANVILVLQASLWIFPFIGLSWFFPEYRNMETLLVFWQCAGVLAVLFFARHLGWETLSQFKLLGFDWCAKEFLTSRYIYVSELISVLMLYADRYVMYLFLTTEIIGLYGLFWQIANAIANLIGAAVHQTFRPVLIALFTSDAVRYRTTSHSLMKKTILSSLVLSVIAFSGCNALFWALDMKVPLENFSLLILVLVIGNCRVVLDTVKLLLFTQSKDKNKLLLDVSFFSSSLFVGLGMYWYGVQMYLVTLAALYFVVFLSVWINKKTLLEI